MKLVRKILHVAALWVFASGASFAGTIHLVQDGWQFGGPLTMTFTGHDADLDGWIAQSELSSFRAVYLLPDGSSTEWLFPDLQPDGFLFMDPGNFLIFAGNADYSLVNAGFEGEVLASVFDRFLFPFDETQGVPSAVPEPEGMAALGVAALGVLWWRKRRSVADVR